MSIEEKFKNINVEPDTKIYAFKYLNLDGIDCRYEFWGWDGIEAESLIFCTPELKACTDDYFRELIGMIDNTKGLEPIEFTSKSNSEFTYLNFNFVVK
ncbi:hypothetical protein [Aquirufa lenticrescens]